MTRFAHDCTNPGCCTFVGETLNCDIYITRSRGLLMRFSNDGPDYRSFPSMDIAGRVARRDAEVFHAIQLAKTC